MAIGSVQNPTPVFSAQGVHEVLIGPSSGSNASPTFRLLLLEDLPDLSSTYITTVGGGGSVFYSNQAPYAFNFNGVGIAVGPSSGPVLSNFSAKFGVTSGDGSFFADNRQILSDGSGNITAASFIGPLAGNATTASTAGTISGTISEAQVVSLTTDLAAKAPLASPSLIGVPLAPTAAANTNTTQLASCAFVMSAIATAVTGLLHLKGSTDCSANPNYPAAVKGDTYIVTVAGKIGGAGGMAVDVGDSYIASADNAGGTQASVGTSWFSLEHNLAGALVSANNLSDLANVATARTNLGLGSAATTSTAAYDVAGAAATVNTALGNHAALTATHGTIGSILGTTDTQTVTNKTIISTTNSISATCLSSGTVPQARIKTALFNNAGLSVADQGTNNLTISPAESLSAARILNLITNDANRTLTFTNDASIGGTNTGDQTTISGNAGTATKLATARNINGTAFDGSASITVSAAAGTLTGSTLASGVTASSLTSLGTLSSQVNLAANIGIAGTNGSGTTGRISFVSTGGSGILYGDMDSVFTGYAVKFFVPSGGLLFYTSTGVIGLNVNNAGVLFPVQATTVAAPSYVKGGIYFDTTLNKLRIGGASGWETVTSA